MQRRASAFLVIVVGVALATTVVANRLTSRVTPFERMTAEYRPLMSADLVATLGRDLDTLAALPGDFQARLVPAIARTLGMTPEQFTLLIAGTYPAVAQGAAAIPSLVPGLRSLVGVLAAERTRFVSTDAIPTTNTSTRSMPWIILGAGVAALILGFGMLGYGWGAPILAAILGALLLAVPLATSMPSKSAAADTLNAHLKPVYTAERVAGARQALATLEAFGASVQNDLVPALARQMGTTPADLATKVPGLGDILTGLPAGLGRMRVLVGTFAGNFDNFRAISPVSFRQITWTSMGGGIAMMFAAGWGMAIGGTAAVVRPHRARIPGRKRAAA
ncbi:MAG: hypothetical protein HY775_12955 [Acidobacteria bacterium]|nr:hypothetical protein [Acidobacteriota bacterium]